MVTRYDILAHIIEKAPCKAKDIPVSTKIYSHINALKKEGLIREQNKQYTPLNNDKTRAAFTIIKYCLNNGLDHNVFFSKKAPNIIQEVFTSAPKLRTKNTSNNKDTTSFLNYLEQQQFILLTKKRPKTGLILKHQLLDVTLSFHNKQLTLQQQPYQELTQEIIQLHAQVLNPFDDNIFSFLTGSAQLEGSTITIGETKELLLHDVYPEKPKKDIQMIKNLHEAIHYIHEHEHEEITPEHIEELNRIILFSLHRNAGKYKKTHNKIAGNPSFKTASPQETPLRVQQYCEEITAITNKKDCVKKTGYIHNELQRIHPFSDGNSRTTRMVLGWKLLQNDVPIPVIKMGCFDAYMRLTKLSQQRDDEELTKLIQHILLHENITKN